eukprot:GEMP01082888.1.p1 GENE.GEMP01082888.1~~GEMP01082888.1.p1  ORF type:complete len:302 (+),score=67.74 GEMP01082888.1:51-908(+)
MDFAQSHPATGFASSESTPAHRAIPSRAKPAPHPFAHRSTSTGSAPSFSSFVAQGPGQWRQTIDPYTRHKQMMALRGPRESVPFEGKSYWDILKDNHRFLRSADDDDGSWEARFAKRYYDRLVKEYVICSLKGYKKGEIGFRWRMEHEVVAGRGQFSCGNRTCTEKKNLRSYEVNFEYTENGDDKQALVKVRLCTPCAFRLNYKHLKKRRRKEKKKKIKKKEKKRRKLDDRSEPEHSDEGSESESDSEDVISGVDSERLKRLAELAKPKPPEKDGWDGALDDLLQ